MAKRIFTENDIARIQISYLYQQSQNIMKANNIRSDLKEIEGSLKDIDYDFESNYMDPKYEFNVRDELYNTPKYHKAYNDYFNGELDKLMKTEYSNIGKGYTGGKKLGGIIVLLLGICSLPFFMLIFPIVLIVTGVRIIKEAKSEGNNNKRRVFMQFGIPEPDSYKPNKMKQQFVDHINKIKQMDDKSMYFELFSREIDSFSKFMYRTYDYHELMDQECIKAKKKEIKEIKTNIKNASKDLLEIAKTLTKKYEDGLKKLDKKLVEDSTGNYYYVGNAVILFEDEDIESLEDLFYLLENNTATVHRNTCYRSEADVEKLKVLFAENTLNDMTEKLEEEGYIILNNDNVYEANPNNDITKKDKDLLDLFLELLDATNSIKEFEKILNE